MEPKKYEYIDSLRGLAILLVVLVHTGNIMERSAFSYMPDVITDFIKYGHMGVRLFFIVSAYTLMLSYSSRKKESHATRNFFIRRFFRIAPMYYFAIVFFTFDTFLGWDFSNLQWEHLSIYKMISNFLFIHGFFPTYINNYVPGGWTISVEFTFYFILPFLCSKITSKNKTIVFTLASLLLSTILAYTLEGTRLDTNKFLSLFFFNQLPIFSLGMLIYWIKTDKAPIKPSVLAFMTAVLFIYLYVDKVPFDFIYSLVFFLLLLLMSIKAYPLFSNKILANIGKVSFSIYLVHFMMLSISGRFNLLWWVDVHDTKTAYFYFIVVYILLAVSSYIVSVFTYRFIEVKGQNLGRKLIQRLNKNVNVISK